MRDPPHMYRVLSLDQILIPHVVFDYKLFFVDFPAALIIFYADNFLLSTSEAWKIRKTIACLHVVSPSAFSWCVKCDVNHPCVRNR